MAPKATAAPTYTADDAEHIAPAVAGLSQAVAHLSALASNHPDDTWLGQRYTTVFGLMAELVEVRNQAEGR